MTSIGEVTHEAVGTPTRVIRYESRCSCGAAFVEPTEIDARQRLEKHQEDEANGLALTEWSAHR